MKNSPNISKGLAPFLPENCVEPVCHLLRENPCHLVVSRPRKTKLGDFKPGKPHRISVNGNLNPYAFLITLIHEYAHLTNWEKHAHRAKAHGVEWKTEFRHWLLPFVKAQVFPPDIEQALDNYLENPAASSCTDLSLQRALTRYDKRQKLLVEHIEEGAEFYYSNKGPYLRGPKIRKRYRCVHISSKKVYLFNPLTPVQHQVANKTQAL